jgi:ABC-type phosphate transport system substrate-binding protein
VVALSAVALIGTAQPSKAQITQGIFTGGSTLASQAFRQIFDCYMGTLVGNDGFTFSAGFSSSPPTPGWLPTTCTASTVAVQGMYAGVGSGNGFRGYLSNTPDQWYGGTVTPTAAPANIPTPFPAATPPYTDSLNVNFGAYPYPHVDIGLSDSPLASTLASLTTVSEPFTPTNNWTTTTQITLGSTGDTQNFTYTTGNWGQPIQVPAFEVGVAIAVNVNGSTLTINSQIQDGSGNIVPGGAIQLTQGQLCAIFSGLVTDWNSTASIPTFFSDGTTSALATQPFDYANVGNGISIAQPYSSSSLPIKVVFRSDGSGTSFILTNYLKAVCPALDTVGGTTFGYSAIFGASNLPSTNFSVLKTNIDNYVPGPGQPTHSTANFVGATASGGVAATVSTASAQAGYLGYVSSDFTSPYAINVTGVPAGSTTATTVPAPLEASLQNEGQRGALTDTPDPTSSTQLTFTPPAPGNVDIVWQDGNINIPDSMSTYNDYNIYGKTYAATQPVYQGRTIANQSIVALAEDPNAYPLAGTTFLALYSCYNDQTRATNILNFLNWLYGNTDPDVEAIIENNGFHGLNGLWLGFQNGYLSPGSGNAISYITSGTDGCNGVTGGAN